MNNYRRSNNVRYGRNSGRRSFGGGIKAVNVAAVAVLCLLSFFCGFLKNFGITNEGLAATSTSECEGQAKMEKEIKRLKGELEMMKRETEDHYEEHHTEDGEGGGGSEVISDDRLMVELEKARGIIARMRSEGDKKAVKNSDKFDFGKTSWVSSVRVKVSGVLGGEYDLPDLGVPPFYGYKGDEEATIFYHKDAVPADGEDPFQRCKEVDVVLTKRNENGHCLVTMEHYSSNFIHRFMRIGKGAAGGTKQGSSLDKALVRVGSGKTWNGAENNVVPKINDSKCNWKLLAKYFEGMERINMKLEPLLKSVARDNTVVVMVANAGVIELLTNFVCAARSKNIDLSHIIMFATDEEGKQAAEELGLTVFYDKEAFGDVPKEHAGVYGDSIFGKMMLIKVYSVHLCMSLGYNVLFQDVDIIWMQDPVPYLQDKTKVGDFDCYFEDDGARSVRYAPWSANSGFYYLNNNDKTRYLITSLLYQMDQIILHHSHQQALSHVLNDHSTFYGLDIKVLPKNLFPGGKSFHHDKPYMLQWMKEELEEEPVMFHMCWTSNKDDKVHYIQQMGYWYVVDECSNEVIRERGGSGTLSNCCSVEPVINCHFKDKPSIQRCDDSPNRDQNGKKFWPSE